MDIDPRDIARSVPEDPDSPADEWVDEFDEIELYSIDGEPCRHLLQMIELEGDRESGKVTHFKTLRHEGTPWLVVWHGDEPEPDERSVIRQINEIYEE